MTRWLGWIAPSAGHALRRTLVIVVAALVVLAATVALEGLPTPKHDLHRNERLVFQADFRRGSVGLLGDLVFIAVWAFVGRRVFQIHL